MPILATTAPAFLRRSGICLNESRPTVNGVCGYGSDEPRFYVSGRGGNRTRVQCVRNQQGKNHTNHLSRPITPRVGVLPACHLRHGGELEGSNTVSYFNIQCVNQSHCTPDRFRWRVISVGRVTRNTCQHGRHQFTECLTGNCGFLVHHFLQLFHWFVFLFHWIRLRSDLTFSTAWSSCFDVRHVCQQTRFLRVVAMWSYPL